MTAEEALEAFAVARKPGVKHERFREALRRRYPKPGCAPIEFACDDKFDGEERMSAFDTVESLADADISDAQRGTSTLPEYANNETLDLDIAVAGAGIETGEGEG
jgi:mRNA-capping enzyme